MNAVSEIPPTAGTAGSTPGALLRQEREQRGLTVQQVSEELHLDAWLVEALEQNRFLALGAPVYAKGHLRKYALLLGLSPELILARYQAVAEPPPPLQLPPREALLTPDTGRGLDWRRLIARLDWRSVDWRTYGVIGALLVVAGGLWLGTRLLRASGDAPQVAQSSQVVVPNVNQGATPQSATPQSATPQSAAVTQVPTEPAAQSVTTAPFQPTAQPTRAPVRANPTQQRPASAPATQPVVAAVPPKPAAVVSTQPTSVPAKSEPMRATAPKVVAPTLTPAAPTRSVEQRVAAVPPRPVAAPATSPSGAVNASIQAPSATDTAEMPQVSLRLEFALASWAEVYDGDGRRLLYAVGDPNRPRTISGKPPLKVTLGQAGSVQARVNGRPIAIPRRIGQEAASFTVGPNGSIR